MVMEFFAKLLFIFLNATPFWLMFIKNLRHQKFPMSEVMLLYFRLFRTGSSLL